MRRPPKKNGRRVLSKRRLAELIEAATVDCYNESEARVGFFTMIEEHLAMPFATTILSVEVQVVGVSMPADESIVAICRARGERQRMPILELPLPSPAPAGSEWIEAYRAWLAGSW